MKPLFSSLALAGLALSAALPVAAQNTAQNGAMAPGGATVAEDSPQPRQYVVVIAEGVSPQLIELTRSYLRKSDDDPELVPAFDELKNAGQSPAVSANAITEMKGVLSLAESNGFKTGLVTTGDLTAVAPLFYNLDGDAATALASAEAQYDFLGGAGGEKLSGAGTAIQSANGTYISKIEDLDNEIKDRVLATREGESFSYAIDRDPTTEVGLAEMAALAMDTLSMDDAPFVLIVHDTKARQALERQDSPALFEQMRELNVVVADALARREENQNFGLSALMTGGNVVPAFAPGANAGNSFFILGNLTRSYAGVGQTLKGATAEEITEFADAENGEYAGWKVSNADKARIVAGELNAEEAVRAAYGPVLGLQYGTQTVAPVAYSVGIDSTPGLVDAIKAAVSIRAQ